MYDVGVENGGTAMNEKNPVGECACCGAPVHFKDERCAKCGAKNSNWTIPDSTRCGNCHALLGEGDKYCRICGTKAGEGEFEPYQQMMQCIYGPRPVSRTHTCEKCGYSWTTCAMLDMEQYCPQCGGNAPCEEDC